VGCFVFYRAGPRDEYFSKFSEKYKRLSDQLLGYLEAVTLLPEEGCWKKFSALLNYFREASRNF
jgi:hypothetical protein